MEKLVLRFAHNIIEHLGLKLYQNKPTNVIAELVSNSWDADAEQVHVKVIQGETGAPQFVAVMDDGEGMSRETLASHYLIVGKPKRTAKNVEKKSNVKQRDAMGRKGIGKLAPFGVANIVDLITIDNGNLFWLRFSLAEIRKHADGQDTIGSYEPLMIADGVLLSDFDVANYENSCPDLVQKFIDIVSVRKSGTMVLASDLTLRRALSISQLRESLGRRFTVTLARPDFKVYVNDDELADADVFPKWFLRIPAEGFDTHYIDAGDGPKKLKFWAGFVNEAEWSQDQAGVGIYAHGKIAQDRPFFFKVKGREIFTRYLYATVEADWLDELPDDVISTDRTSIDWEHPMTESLMGWGADKVKEWIKLYEQKRKEKDKEENEGAVKNIEQKTNQRLTDVEREGIISLLGEITPRLSKDNAQTEQLAETLTRAWVHQPTRRMVKDLWERLSESETADDFATTVHELGRHMVPEALTLSVSVAQRIFAITELESTIFHKGETALQELIEQFPWILDPTYHKFTANKPLKTHVLKAVDEEGLSPSRYMPTKDNEVFSGATKPDFVFFSNTEDTEILVVELKNPQNELTLENLFQLESYTGYLKIHRSGVNLRSLLVGNGDKKKFDSEIKPYCSVQNWDEILLKSRLQHAYLLAALLGQSNPDPQDTRIGLIKEFGGAATRELLTRFSQRDERLRDLMDVFTSASAVAQATK